VADDHDLEKYSRQIILNEIGHEGQEKLKKASVLIIGIGGLGSSVIQYLNVAGVGRIGIVDYDKVELSNLNRQLIYKESDLGKNKVDVAKNYISELNPSSKIEIFKLQIDKNNLILTHTKGKEKYNCSFLSSKKKLNKELEDFAKKVAHK